MAALVACADPVERIAAPPDPATDVRAAEAAAAAAERAALERIGRVVALSLGERSARQQVKNELRAAPFKEHKLELGRYLRGDNGKQLLARARGAGASDDVLTLIEQVRPLEFYMPVRKHRETWVGDEEVLVAVQLEEEDPIIAFNARGESIILDGEIPPEQPMLSIVPVETRFDRPMPANSRNVGDRDGKAIGTLMPVKIQMSSIIEDDGGGGGGGGGGGSSIPPGLYLEFSRILDLHEPFTRGDPEIEVHIQGPNEAGNPRQGIDLSCSGEHAYDYRKVFDQNGGFWEGRVMLFSDDEVTRFNDQFQDGFHVLFWEDDNSACVLKLDSESLIEFLKSTSQAAATVAIKLVPKAPWYVVAGAFFAVLFENAGAWLTTNDDFVGAAVDQKDAGYSYPENTHVIMKGSTLNGRATIIYR